MPDRPFAELLDEALSARGLSLERVAHKVGEHGAQVSVSTLSLWRRGRTRPTRQRSQAVLTALEDILQLRAGELSEALAVPEAREPEWWAIQTPTDQLSSTYQAYEVYREAVGAPTSRAERWVVSVMVEVDADRRRRRVQMSQVLHANVEPVDSLAVLYWSEDPTEDDQPQVYEVSEVVGARATRTVEFQELGAVATVLELDEPLQVGETTSFDLTVDLVTEAPRMAGDGWFGEELQMPWPVAALVLEVRFAGEPPRRARARVGQDMVGTLDLRSLPARTVAPSAFLQVNSYDVARGGLRLEWSWGEDGEDG